ncbi:MAG: ribosome maturation factor [Sphingobacteriia bacterium]|nr:MAG: ribosome maturation factor [Sphingobacteriia bacterium]
MATNPDIEKTEALIGEILAQEPGYFLVSVRIKPTNNVKVFMDGDEGLPIAKCVQFNRALYKSIVESGLFPDGEFSLEVSSPGADEPLLFPRQYTKHVGRDLELVLADGTIKTGKLLTVAEADILLETTTGKGKKAVTEQILVPFDQIKTSTVQLKF